MSRLETVHVALAWFIVLSIAVSAEAAPTMRVESQVQGGGYSAYHRYWASVPFGSQSNQVGTGSVLQSSTPPEIPFAIRAQSGTTSGTNPPTNTASIAEIDTGRARFAAISEGTSYWSDRTWISYSYSDDIMVTVSGGGSTDIEFLTRIQGNVSGLSSVSQISGYVSFGFGAATFFRFGQNVSDPPSSATQYVAQLVPSQTFVPEYAVVSSDPTNLIFYGKVPVTSGSTIPFVSSAELACTGGAKCDYASGGAYGLSMQVLHAPGVVLTSAATGGPVLFAEVPEPGFAAMLGSGVLGAVALGRSGARARAGVRMRRLGS